MNQRDRWEWIEGNEKKWKGLELSAENVGRIEIGSCDAEVSVRRKNKIYRNSHLEMKFSKEVECQFGNRLKDEEGQ